jgi:capsular polysaccharide biosynthesis protein
VELRHYLLILRQRLLLIVATIALALAAAWQLTPKSTEYVANSTIYVGTRQFELGSATSDLDLQQLTALDKVLLTYSFMIDSVPVAAEALQRVNIDRSAEALVAQTTALPRPNTQLLRIEVRDSDPTIARDLANALAAAFVDNIQAYEGGPSEEANFGDLPRGLPAYVFEQAGLPTRPQPVNLLNNLVLGTIFGALAAAGLVFALDYLDVTVRSPSDAERRLDLPVLGVIPVIDKSGNLAAVVRRTARARPAREIEHA